MLKRLQFVLGGCVGEGTQDSDRIVACCRNSADLFYDEQRWPEGVELYDWVYK